MSERGLNADKEFTCSYEFDGQRWAVTLFASTPEEAEMKLRAMGQGRVDGRLMGRIPADGRCPTCGHDAAKEQG